MKSDYKAKLSFIMSLMIVLQTGHVRVAAVIAHLKPRRRDRVQTNNAKAVFTWHNNIAISH